MEIFLNKIWLSSYPTDVPAEIDPDRYSSLVSMFESSVQRYAKRIAYINMGTEITFKQLNELSRNFAAFLQNELKLQKGDRVALILPNILQFSVALWGVFRAGFVVVNVNPLYKERELQFQLKDCGAKAVVVLNNFAGTLAKVIHNTDIKHVVVTKLGDMFPCFKRVVINVLVKYIKQLVPKYHLPNTISFTKALQLGKKTRYIRPKIGSEDLAILQYTGGTTGIAKGAMLTHRNMLANTTQAYGAFLPVLQKNGELIVTALPLYHIFALTINCLLFVQIGGCSLLITNPKDINGLIKAIAKYPFTAITGVNTLFNALIHNENFKKIDFSHLHLSIGGGMSIHRSVADNWKKLTNDFLLEGYGLTECSPIVAANPYNIKEHKASIGIPIPSTEVRIVDNNMNDVPLGEPGELLVKGPQVMKGYWNNEEATAEIMYDGWLRTGDIATMDMEGFIRIVDRKKDMILVSGFNVYPNEIEDVLTLNDKIKESAVIGVASDKTGETVKACIVKKDESLTEAEVIAHCRKYLTSYKLPKLIEFFDVLPKTDVGKILRKALKEHEKENAER